MDQNISTSLLLFHEVQDKSSGCLLEWDSVQLRCIWNTSSMHSVPKGDKY
jgi:hypothetical protein